MESQYELIVSGHRALRRWRTGAVMLLSVLFSHSWPAIAAGPAGNREPEPQASPLVRIEVRGPAQEAFEGQPRGGVPGQLQREIVDPCLGTRWELIADALHPERPGRLIQVGAGVPPQGQTGSRLSIDGVHGVSQTDAAQALSTTTPLIRAGDRVTVIQETAMLRARLQAVALEPAVKGHTMRVRLIGGQDTRTGNQGAVILVRALSPGEVGWLAVDRNP